MKILDDYKRIARQFIFEVDDEKMIKYKDEDGESKEMKAGSAKTMPDEHPAKQAYNKMKDGGDDKEEPSGQKLGGGDFERDGGTDSDDKDSDSGDEEFTIDQQIADIEKDIAFADKQDSPYWDKEGARLRNVLKNMQKEKEAQDDKKDGDFEKNMAKDDSDDADEMIAKHGKTSLPKGTDSNTEVDNIDYDELEAFYDNVAKEYAEKYDIDMEAMDDAMSDTLSDHLGNKEPSTMSDLVNSIKSTAQEYVKENIKPKKKPFLKEQLERFGGLK